MKVYSEIIWSMTPEGLEFVSEKSFEYAGKLELYDRAAHGEAQQAENQAGTTASGYGQQAQEANSSLSPFYNQEMRAEHGFDPTQTNELLTAAGAGTGGATGALQGTAEQEAARTRNPSGFTKSLDEAARDKNKALAANSEGVAAQDVMGAKQLNQEGAAGLQGLYGTDVKGQLDAMGQQSQDINAEVNADKAGWLQNMDQTISSIGTLATGAGAMGAKLPGTGCWIAATVYDGWDDPRVSIARNFIFNDWANRSIIGKYVAKAYIRYGERVAKVVSKSNTLKAMFKNLFDRTL